MNATERAQYRLRGVNLSGSALGRLLDHVDTLEAAIAGLLNATSDDHGGLLCECDGTDTDPEPCAYCIAHRAIGGDGTP